MTQRIPKKLKVVNALGGKSEVRFGGRTVKVVVSINTDEDENVVAKRIHEAARGPNQRMAVTGISTTTDETEYWNRVFAGLPS